MLYGFKRNDVNMVCGYQNILKKGIYGLFIRLGIISKYLYQPDIACTKNILKILKNNGTIGIFPEGIQSTSGSTQPINPATAQLIKKSKATVIVSTSKGAYLATNRYSKDRKKGYIGIEYSLAFTPEMLDNLNEEQIYTKLLEKIKYDDFEYNKTARNKYIGKKPNAFGIDKILYKCPECKTEYSLYTEEDTIKCKCCGLEVKVNEYYDLVSTNNKIPMDIDKWYKWQRRCVAKEITNDNFELSFTGSLANLRLDKLRKEPNNRQILSVGTATLTKEGLLFKGVLNNQTVDYEFSPKSLYSLTLSTKGYLEFYYNNEYFLLIPDNPNQCLIKWTLASEEIHNLYDEKWRTVCEDVYEYDKGEIYE